MRCDVNISVREAGSDKLGTRVEIKNMNSLRAISAAIAYESRRHIDALESGDEVLVQETRGWNDSIGKTFSMREKETAADYRYFPNPELMPIFISDEWIYEIRAGLPEPARAKYARLTGELGISEFDSGIITGSKALSDIFDQVTRHFDKPKEVANWIVTELLGIATGDNKGGDDIHIDCVKFARLLELVDKRIINRSVGKKLLVMVLEEGIDPAEYVEANNLGMVVDTDVIGQAIREALAENPKSVEEYINGNQKVLGFFVGGIMRKLGGKADPKVVNELLIRQLK